MLHRVVGSHPPLRVAHQQTLQSTNQPTDQSINQSNQSINPADSAINQLINQSIDTQQVLHPTRHKIGHFEDILPGQPISLLLYRI